MFDALVLQWRVSVDYTEVHIVPHRQSFFRIRKRERGGGGGGGGGHYV